MYDELRSNHEPTLTPEEHAWMETNPVAVVVKAFALAVVAIGIGVSVSHLLTTDSAFPQGTIVATP
jgi:hypothetical protein